MEDGWEGSLRRDVSIHRKKLFCFRFQVGRRNRRHRGWALAITRAESAFLCCFCKVSLGQLLGTTVLYVSHRKGWCVAGLTRRLCHKHPTIPRNSKQRGWLLTADLQELTTYNTFWPMVLASLYSKFWKPFLNANFSKLFTRQRQDSKFQSLVFQISELVSLTCVYPLRGTAI